jgi:hypothetical protein
VKSGNLRKKAERSNDAGKKFQPISILESITSDEGYGVDSAKIIHPKIRLGQNRNLPAAGRKTTT